MTTIAERTQFPQILLIEDNRGDAMLIRMAFKKAELHGHVSVAPTAEIGLQMLHQQGEYADAKCPDLILIDLNLPSMGGCECLKRIKADPHLRLIPAIMLSSSKADTDLAPAYMDYANGYITKPFGLDDYHEVVATIEDYWFKLAQTPATHSAAADTAPWPTNGPARIQ